MYKSALRQIELCEQGFSALTLIKAHSININPRASLLVKLMYFYNYYMTRCPTVFSAMKFSSFLFTSVYSDYFFLSILVLNVTILFLFAYYSYFCYDSTILSSFLPSWLIVSYLYSPGVIHFECSTSGDFSNKTSHFPYPSPR